MVETNKRIIRVFPTRTAATPDDPLVYVDRKPDLIAEADEVHISVVFSWDLPKAEKLARVWRCVASTKIGGPATGEHGEGFTPGLYLRHGYTITSRGCPNKCWFCSVWKRDGPIRELPIKDGWNVQDDNLLACSDQHIKSVFEMVRRQKREAVFAGGFEAKRLKDWQVNELANTKLRSVFFAYDTPDDYDPLREAAKKLIRGGLIVGWSNFCRCFVLVGYPKDTYGLAEKRIQQVIRLGFFPFVMVYRDDVSGSIMARGWESFVKRWNGSSFLVRAAICNELRKPFLKRYGGNSASQSRRVFKGT